MGFGTLFIGYFLLLNLTYYGFTDCIAALIMLLGLYKLASVNKRFLMARNASVVFAVFGLGELVITVLEMLTLISLDSVIGYISVFRSLIICVMTVLMLSGMEQVAKEVELERIPSRCRVLFTSTFIVYGLWIILEAPLPEWIPAPVHSILMLLAIISLLFLVAANLVTIYGCYMRICMPGEENNTKKQKPSRFAFVNDYRARKEEKERADAEYRMEQYKKRQEKRRKRK